MADAQASSFLIQCDLWPTDGQPKSTRVAIDFSKAASYDYDLVLETLTNQTESVQGIFIDNSDNAASVTINFKVNQHRLVIPPYGQGSLPVFGGAPLQFSASSTGGVVVPVHFLNVPTPWAVWGPVTIGGGGGSALPVNPTQNAVLTANNVAGTGADATVLAANAARKSLQLMAPSGNNNVVRINWGAATVGAGQDYELTPGGIWQPPPNINTLQSIHANIAVGDHLITIEGT